MTEDEQIKEVAEQWREREPDAQFVGEIDRLIAARRFDDLRRYFNSRLTFGTAGLRGTVGWGSGSMNEANVARASWALGQFLLGEFSPLSAGTPPSVVLGFDARPESERYCRLSAEVLVGLGCRVKCATRSIPTPLVAFLVRAEQHHAGVVVTASHNPRGDNGFKVYDAQGVQISSPWDTKISEWIAKFPPWNSIALGGNEIVPISREEENRYLDYVGALARELAPAASRAQCRIGYTPLHGVAKTWIERALASTSPNVEIVSVPEQAEPDGSFPTTPFPNPEEPGALDPLLSLGREHNCSLLMANDPDGDRFAVCVKEGSGYLKLSGDAVGLVLADALIDVAKVKNPVVISTIVSSPALEALATLKGATAVRTLTGFKWLCRAALAHEKFIFAYEEALGYCFAPPTDHRGVMDKDGIAAAAILARLFASDLDKSQDGPMGRLRALYAQLGLFGSFGVSRRFEEGIEDPAARIMSRFMTQLRASGPALDWGWQLTDREDFLEGASTRPSYLGGQDLLRFRLSREKDGPHEPFAAEVLVRPSGTEAKVKAYVHLRAAFDAGLTLGDQLASLEPVALRLGNQFLSLT